MLKHWMFLTLPAEVVGLQRPSNLAQELGNHAENHTYLIARNPDICEMHHTDEYAVFALGALMMLLKSA